MVNGSPIINLTRSASLFAVHLDIIITSTVCSPSRTLSVFVLARATSSAATISNNSIDPVQMCADPCKHCIVVGSAILVTPAYCSSKNPLTVLLAYEWSTTVSLATTSSPLTTSADHGNRVNTH